MDHDNNLFEAYRTACRAAEQKLREVDPEEIALKSGTHYDITKNLIELKYLNEVYTVDFESFETRKAIDGSEAQVAEKTLMLHYLLHSRASHLTGRMISFREVEKSGLIYYRNFCKRAIEPFVSNFKNDIEGFYKAAYRLGGARETYGSASAALKLFPQVPATYVLWQGDEEFDASGTILFDSSVSDFLPGEDIVIAASFATYKMMGISKGKSQ